MEEAKAVCGCADIAELLKEAIREIAEKAGISLEEAADYISKMAQGIQERIVHAADWLAQALKALEESGIFDIEPRPRRRKRERSRARLIEQLYRAEIRRAERERPFRRVYKPP